jgi:N-methylhydantoinase A/oxoprolinase/acetone carboxylase beta subunit
VDVHTVGLGGDSQVHVDEQGRVSIGPRRVTPLCLLASEHPEIVAQLEQQLAARHPADSMGQFVLGLYRPAAAVSEDDQELLNQIARSPQTLSALAGRMRTGSWVTHQIERLESQRLALRAGFTPTDALHVLGRFQRWNAEAAQLGAAILARRTGLSIQALCERIVSGVSDRVTQALVTKVLSDEAVIPDWESEPAAGAFLARALGHVSGSDLGCRLSLNTPIVAVGAPVEAYLPGVAGQLNTELVIPAHADVANAVGAVAGSVVQRLQVMIRPLDDDHHVRLHLPEAVLDFPSVEEGVAYAEQVVMPEVLALARKAGADDVQVRMTREDQYVPTQGGWDDQIYLGTELTFTAVGRPTLAKV